MKLKLTSFARKTPAGPFFSFSYPENSRVDIEARGVKIKPMSKPNLVAPESGVQDNSDVIISDPDNPRAITNLVPEKVRDHILNVITNYPQYFGDSEHELRLLLKPDDTVCRVRIAFWHEYFRAQDQGCRMQMSRIYSGVTSHDVFYGTVLSRPQNVAWILCPPVKYMLAMEEALNRGLHNLTKLMGMEVVDDKGQVNVKAANIFLKAFELLNERVNGAVVQRIEQKNLTLTRKVDGEAPADMEALQEELLQLRKKSRLLPAIEAKAVDEENT